MQVPVQSINLDSVWIVANVNVEDEYSLDDVWSYPDAEEFDNMIIKPEASWVDVVNRQRRSDAVPVISMKANYNIGVQGAKMAAAKEKNSNVTTNTNDNIGDQGAGRLAKKNKKKKNSTVTKLRKDLPKKTEDFESANRFQVLADDDKYISDQGEESKAKVKKTKPDKDSTAAEDTTEHRRSHEDEKMPRAPKDSRSYEDEKMLRAPKDPMGTTVVNACKRVVIGEIKAEDLTKKSAIKFCVADVGRPLASAAKVAEAGNVIVMDPRPDSSYIMNIDSGEKMSMRIERGVYVVDVLYDDGETGAITIDSGAGISVWPRNMKASIPMGPKSDVVLSAANGTPIANLGTKIIGFRGRKHSPGFTRRV